MKQIIFLLALGFSASASADLFTTSVCEVVASNYARGSAVDKGREGVRIEEVQSMQLAPSTLIVTAKTSYVEDFLKKSGSNYSYYCYRCGETDIRVSVESNMAEVCK